MDKRYIIVGFSDGIGHTLQVGNRLAWNFSRKVKSYKNLSPAIKEAHRVNARWKCDRVVVYHIGVEERISCSYFDRWEDKIAFEIKS
jgi:hypothetical protein